MACIILLEWNTSQSKFYKTIAIFFPIYIYIYIYVCVCVISKGIQTFSSIELFPLACAVPSSPTHQVITGRNQMGVAPRC